MCEFCDNFKKAEGQRLKDACAFTVDSPEKFAKAGQSGSVDGYVDDLINYIMSDSMYEEFPSDGADYEDLARDIWPKRMAKIKELAVKIGKTRRKSNDSDNLCSQW